jgi:predicted DNA-binding transcriptional regulator AlpA
MALSFPQSTDKKSSVEDLRLLKFEEVALQLGWSAKHFERIVQSGKGPKVTKLSPKNRGVRADHLREWLDERAMVADAG